MNKEEFRKVKQIFQAALDIAPENRRRKLGKEMKCAARGNVGKDVSLAFFSRTYFSRVERTGGMS